jgi:hypothetical protein
MSSGTDWPCSEDWGSDNLRVHVGLAEQPPRVPFEAKIAQVRHIPDAGCLFRSSRINRAGRLEEIVTN